MENSHESLMGKNYVTFPMGYSWERITSFTPWVTHGIELRAFIARKMPKSRHSMCDLIQGKFYVICLKGIFLKFSRDLAMNLI